MEIFGTADFSDYTDTTNWAYL